MTILGIAIIIIVAILCLMGVVATLLAVIITIKLDQ